MLWNTKVKPMGPQFHRVKEIRELRAAAPDLAREDVEDDGN